MATAVIVALILGYCEFLIYRAVRNKKEGRGFGCGCSGSCSSCPGGCSSCARPEAPDEK